MALTVTTAPLERSKTPNAGSLIAPPASRRRRRWEVAGVGLAAVVATAAWLPFLHRPLSSDESGFLLLAQQWRPGTSLYGNYWVDRPPLLMWLFHLAGLWGPPGVKVMGAVASGLSVVLAAVLAHVLAPEHPGVRRATVVVTTALLCSPLLGMPETDGEVLALPFVLTGLACLIASARRDWGARTALLTMAAGAAAVCSALVKQNMIDVFVFALVFLLLVRRRLPHWGVRVLVFASSSLTALVGAIAAADARGTSPHELWDAIVVFRIEAADVIGSAGADATAGRLVRLVLASLTSGVAFAVVLGVAVLVAVQVLRRRRSNTALVWGTVAMVGWEVCGVALGGSYWLHYLTALVPGVVVMTALLRPTRRAGRVLVACVVYAVLAASVAWGHRLTKPAIPSEDAHVAAYLRAHSGATDGVVVAFGHPDIVTMSGLTSPYEYLWSLPVRVRDANLHAFSGILDGGNAPRWVVVAGPSLDSWGLHAQTAEQALNRHYVEQVAYGKWRVWQHEGAR